MKTIVLMYYDERRKIQADLSVPAARAWAERNDYTLIVNETKGALGKPYFEKVHQVNQHLPACDRLIYADVDILFRPGSSGEPLFIGDFNTASDPWGICTGFMALKNTAQVKKLIRIWGDLGHMRCGLWHDQGCFKTLVAQWKWIDDMVSRIPENIVSCHASPDAGAVAHHFWGQANVEDSFRRMSEWVWPPASLDEARIMRRKSSL